MKLNNEKYINTPNIGETTPNIGETTFIASLTENMHSSSNKWKNINFNSIKPYTTNTINEKIYKKVVDNIDWKNNKNELTYSTFSKNKQYTQQNKQINSTNHTYKKYKTFIPTNTYNNISNDTNYKYRGQYTENKIETDNLIYELPTLTLPSLPPPPPSTHEYMKTFCGENAQKLTLSTGNFTHEVGGLNEKRYNYYSQPQYCNNCGKYGHLFHQCKYPITSFGVICYRKKEDKINGDKIEYLMIRRKDTLGLVDFIRGKYNVNNKEYIMNMLKQMTIAEKEMLCEGDFDKIWNHVWVEEKTNINKNRLDTNVWNTGDIAQRISITHKQISEQHKHEENISRDKYNTLKQGVFVNGEFYTLNDLVEQSHVFGKWNEAEWGFPKGRRNSFEKDFDCALREFCEETGYEPNKLTLLKNIMPFEEIFTGSNYKSYKHKYYVMYTNYNDCDTSENMNIQISEIGKCMWKTYDECVNCIRPYNLEKLRLLKNVHTMLQ